MIQVTQNKIGKPEIEFQENLKKSKTIGYMELIELTGKFQGKKYHCSEKLKFE